jgi:asparagine synthase (glutamine-hydrolysing)
VNGKRFIALIANDTTARLAWEQASARVLAQTAGFKSRKVGNRLTLLCENGASLAIGEEGFVIGRLFSRGQTGALQSVDVETSRSIIASRGDWLIRAHWGAYVAILAARESDSVDVVRAPLGDLPCYTFRSSSGLFLGSDVEMFVRFAGFVPQIDWSQLALHLGAPDLYRRRTCLVGLDELSGGERMTDIAGHTTHLARWTPWDFVGIDRRFNDPIEAASRVRDVVRIAVAAQASGYDKVLLRLSGGLDSSIVAAALAHANQPFVTHTLVTRDRGGDERVHAQAVADHLGVTLVEAQRDLNLVDITASDAHCLPRPSARAFVQASSRIARNVASSSGASVIFDGGGGDNVFASLQSTAPVADCLKADGGNGYFWRTARSIGISAHASTIKVARAALVRSWMRGPGFRWSVDLTLLSDEARRIAAEAADHPWLAPPAGALAGSAAHIALLAAAQSVVQSRNPSVPIPDVSPLISQPVAEACLRVPSWLWTHDGHNRVIARDAFRDALPQSIVDRRGKGIPDSFMVELIDANLDLIRDMLTNGELARNRMIDRAAVSAALAPAAIAKGFGYIRIMQLVDVEAWVRSWGGRG